MIFLQCSYQKGLYKLINDKGASNVNRKSDKIDLTNVINVPLIGILQIDLETAQKKEYIQWISLTTQRMSYVQFLSRWAWASLLEPSGSRTLLYQPCALIEMNEGFLMQC